MTRATRSRAIFIILIATLAVALLTLGTFTIVNLSTRNAGLNERVAEQNATIDQLYDDLRAEQENARSLYNQLLELDVQPEGEKPVVTPIPPSAQGERGATGATGQTGQTGAAGRPPTSAEISAAVAAYCAANDACRGQPGRDGTNGTNGTNGAPGESVTGPPGPVGTPGPAGPAGASCPDGYAFAVVWLSIAETQFGIFSRQQAAVCRPTT